MTDKEIFLSALDQPPAARVGYLEQACGGDAELRRRVEALLKAHDEASRFLAESAGGAVKTEQVLSAPPVFGRDRPGAVIAGRYKLLQQIGEGGMGAVWMAEQLQPLRRQVALKLIKPGMDSKQVLARFEAERQALALMDHPNIARVFDGGAAEDGRPFFVMELVKGAPITQYCDDRQLSLDQRLALFADVCHAVQHAHQKGILHRDLKPSNLLVTEHDGKPMPKVIDFGLAKALHGPQALTEQTLHTSFGAVVGTPLYMAPEQVALNALDVDTRADIYALGVVLYELLTGTTPFTKERFQEAAWDEVRRLIREEEPQRPSTRLSSTDTLPSIAARRQCEPQKLGRFVRGDLDWIVMKALEKDRNRRYETANALAMDVQRHLADEPVSAGPPSAGYRLRKFVRRRRGPVLAAAAMLLMLLAGVVGTAWGLLNARQERDRAEAAREEAVRQRQLAEAEMRKAQAVVDFLQNDLLGQASLANQPKEAGERSADLKVRTLLERAGAELEGKFKEQPETEAALRLTVGDALAALALYPEADRQLQRALRLAERDPNDGLRWRIQASLASLRVKQGELGEAQQLFDGCVAHETKAKGAADPATLALRINQASVARLRGKLPEAEAALRQMLERHRSALPRDKELLAVSLLADTLGGQGRFAEAEPLYREAIAGRTELLGADHPLTLASRGNLASNLMAQRRLAEAAEQYQELAAQHAEKFGPDHPETLVVRGNLGLALQRQGKRAEAEALFRDVLAKRIAKLGPDHPATLATRHNLAVLLVELKRLDQAEALLRENVEACVRKLGADHPDTIVVKAALSATLRDLNKFAEAEPLSRACHAAAAKRAPNQPLTFMYQANLGYVLLKQKKLDEAEAHLRAAFERLRPLAGTREAKDWPSTVAQWLADLGAAKGDEAEAAKWREEAANLRPAASKPTASQPAPSPPSGMAKPPSPGG